MLDRIYRRYAQMPIILPSNSKLLDTSRKYDKKLYILKSWKICTPKIGRVDSISSQAEHELGDIHHSLLIATP